MFRQIYDYAIYLPAKLVGRLLGEASILVVCAGAIAFTYLSVRLLSRRLPYDNPLNKLAYWIVGAFFFMYGGLFTNAALRHMAAAIFKATDFTD